MVEQKVDKIATPISEAEMTRVFIDVVKELYGITLSKPQLAILIAQNNLETGHRKFMYNNNIGNITHVSGDNHDFYLGGDSTKRNGKWVPTTFKFRSYPDIHSAAKDYIQNLKRRGSGSVWEGIMKADPGAFSKALKKTRYYEADEDKYTAGIVSGANSFNKSDSYEKALSSKPPSSVQSSSSLIDKIDALLNNVMKTFSNDRSIKKKAFQKLIPNEFLISVSSSSTHNSIEFARILCQVIDEELFSNAQILTDHQDVEIETTLNGPQQLCQDALLQLCNTLSMTFEKATEKIGGVEVFTSISPNMKSNLNSLNIKTACQYYDKFHQQFNKRI
jgi:hypothetical protein